ncbi:hypothetical protein [Streptomyces sp. NPDC093261]|uniref:hypothetical protein n=1 Tax=Streptomyces sp. NPDC093261 TaxID=3366037 RepID=UPI00380F2A92
MQGLRSCLGSDSAGSLYVPRRESGGNPYRLAPACAATGTDSFNSPRRYRRSGRRARRTRTPGLDCDRDVLQAEAAVDGWYALLTTLTPKQAGAAEVLRRHKGQQGTVERRYGDAKGPPGRHSPSSCRTDKPVAALVAVICLDLLIFGLIERQVRRALGGDQKMRGLYSGTQMSAPPAG